MLYGSTFYRLCCCSGGSGNGRQDGSGSGSGGVDKRGYTSGGDSGDTSATTAASFLSRAWPSIVDCLCSLWMNVCMLATKGFFPAVVQAYAVGLVLANLAVEVFQVRSTALLVCMYVCNLYANSYVCMYVEWAASVTVYCAVLLGDSSL